MFISNLDNDNKRYYECGKLVGNYLIKSGITLLGQRDRTMMFAKTKKLQNAIDKMPGYLKILVKGGIING